MNNNIRILLVDDNENIHRDFKKILEANHQDQELDAAKTALFGKNSQEPQKLAKAKYIIDSAYQGQEALEMVKKSIKDNKPYALAFVDIRMPPGWDGIVTIKHLWGVDANLQIVICTAYSDYSWEEISKQLYLSDNFLILKKPFDLVEICQLAAALSKKWELKKQVQFQIENLNRLVAERTQEVQKSFSLIKATLNSIQEGILAISQDLKIISYNQILLQLWNISEEQIQYEPIPKILKLLSDQIEETGVFANSMQQLITNPRIGMIREWKLKNERIFELYAQPQYLNDKIIGCVFSFRDITERKNLERQLSYQATHDSLTGLPNRALLLDRIKQAIAQAKRQQLMVGILLFDLDNFKHINDSLGHHVGDALLKQVAARLSNSVRESDTVSRLGGDEFVVILVAQHAEDDILERANHLLTNFSMAWKVDDRTLNVMTSIGISIYPKDGNDPQVLLKNADVALYHAKDFGKNMYKLYSEEFNNELVKQGDLLADLHMALEKNQFCLYYQPLIELNSGKILGAEVLMRWNHPSLGLILPNKFIPLAEKAGLISKIGEWVLRTACKQNVEWQKSLDEHFMVSVNVSAYQFLQKDFVKIVKDILNENKLDAKYLTLEITETVLLNNISDISDKMLELKKLGVHFSIDDFGTGYASISYLKFFPFDTIKIDKSFINGLSANADDKTIVEAIINMTSPIGMDVLAEGVERQDQIDFLQYHNVNKVQGNFYSPPLDKKQFQSLLKKKLLIKE